MFDTDQHIKRINEKLQQVLKQYASLQKENEKLKSDLFQAKSLIKEKEDQIELSILRLEVLKASKGEMTEEEKKSFQKKINHYLKEIEKCINYLNE